MDENRTEKPTKQKLKKARERGQVAKSTFLAGAVVFAGGVVLIWGLSSLFASRFQASMRAGFSLLEKPEIKGAMGAVIGPLLLPLLITLFGILVIAVGAHLFQTGWIWAPEQIKPKWRKKKGERRFILPLLQLAFIAGAGYLALRAKLDPRLLFSSVEVQLVFIFKKLIFLSLEISALLLFLGLCDFIYQKWRYHKQMHMTPEEKKAELRESEGDPSMKGRMRDRRD